MREELSCLKLIGLNRVGQTKAQEFVHICNLNFELIVKNLKSSSNQSNQNLFLGLYLKRLFYLVNLIKVKLNVSSLVSTQ